MRIHPPFVSGLVILCALLVPQAARAQSPVDLVAHWQLDEGRRRIANDSAGDHRGRLEGGASWTIGQSGTAASLDGIDDYISVPGFDIQGSGLTVAAWVRPASFPDGVDARFVSKASGAAAREHVWMLGLRRNRLRFQLQTSGATTLTAPAAGRLTANTWHHVAATYDGAMMRLYLDGVDVDATAKTGPVATDPGVPVNLGRSPDGSHYLHGALDDVRVYERGLSAAEIAALAGGSTTGAGDQPTSGSGSSGQDGPVALWPLDEGAGAVAADAAGGYAGTLRHGASWTTGRSGAAVSLDGIDDYISVPAFDVHGSGLTIAAWVRLASVPDDVDPQFVSKAEGTAARHHHWMLGLRRGRLQFRLKTAGTTTLTGRRNASLPIGAWAHVAATYDGAMMRVYLNGADVGATEQAGIVVVDPSLPIAIGRNPAAASHLHGAIDDVRLYARGLTSAEIGALAAGIPPASGSAPPNAPPSVSLSTPSNGATYGAPATVSLGARAGDNDGSVARVDFYANGVLVGSDTSAPHTATWRNVPAGSYALVAMARDDDGATTTSASRSIVVSGGGNQYPTVSLASPAAGSTFAQPVSIAVGAIASDPDGSVARVDFYAGSTLIGTDSSRPYAVTWSNPPVGTHAITAVAWDNLGWSAASHPATVTVYPPLTSRRAVFTPPLHHATAVDRYVLDVFRASDNPLTAVAIATQNLGKPGVVNGEISVDVSDSLIALPPGEYVAVVTAIGSAGTAPSAPSPVFSR